MLEDLRKERDDAAQQAADIYALVEKDGVEPDPTQPLAVQLDQSIHRLSVVVGLLRREKDARRLAEQKYEVDAM